MVRLKDIAKVANLNVSTVSRALLNRPDISEDTRERVRKIADEMGYSPRSNRPKFIGIVVPEVTSQYYAELVETLEERLRDNGYSTMYMLTGFNPIRIERAIKELESLGAAGIIINEISLLKNKFQEKTKQNQLPTVILSEVRSVSPLDLINIDQHRIVSLAVEHLKELGHTEIGYIGEVLSDVRYRAYLDIMEKENLPIDKRFVKVGKERFEKGGYLRAKELLKEDRLPTAVFASYDQIAVGAIKAFGEAGLKVPKDISIIGVDNIVADDYMSTKLTSITNPVEQLGIVTVKLLLSQINNPSTHVVQHVALQSKLVIRDSTGPPRKG